MVRYLWKSHIHPYSIYFRMIIPVNDQPAIGVARPSCDLCAGSQCLAAAPPADPGGPRKIKEVGDFSIKHTLVGGIPTPLKNDGVRQLGSWNSQLFLESHKTNVPVITNQIRFILQEFRHWLCLKSRIAMDPPWTLVFFGHLEYPLVI